MSENRTEAWRQALGVGIIFLVLGAIGYVTLGMEVGITLYGISALAFMFAGLFGLARAMRGAGS